MKRFLGAILVTSLLAACSGPDLTVDTQTPLHRASDTDEPVYAQVVNPKILFDPAVMPPVETIPVGKRCSMPRASNGAKVVYINSYGGGERSPLHNSYKGKEGSREHHKRIDIVITETEQPIYLLLDSYNSVLWNLQKAPGVEVDGVAIISYEPSSLLNGPKPNRVSFHGLRGYPGKRCYERGGKPVSVKDRAAAARANGYEPTASDLQKYAETNREMKNWHERYIPRMIGKRIDEMIFPRNDGNYKAVMIGPIPATPIPGQPPEKLQVADYINVAWGTREAALQELDEIDQKALEDLRAGMR